MQQITASDDTFSATDRRYQMLYEHATDMVALLDPDGTYRYVSPSHDRILGYKPADLLGTSAFALVHPDDVAHARAEFVRGLETREQGVTARLRVRHADGAWRLLEVAGYNRIGDPVVQGFIVNSQDVTARLQAEEALRSERARMELLLDSARALISSVDRASILHMLAARLIAVLNAAGASFTQIDPVTRTVHSPIHHVAPGRRPLVTHGNWVPLSSYPILQRVVDTAIPWSGHADDPDFPETERAFLATGGMRAEVLVPITVREQVASVLEVYWDGDEHVSADTVAVCAAIGEQAGIALENALLYATEAELRRSAEVRAQRLEHVQRVGERLKADLDESEIGQRVVMAASEALGFNMVVLNLVDEPDNPEAPWRVVATVGIPPEGVEVLCANAYGIANVQALMRSEFRISRSFFIPEESEAICSQSEVPRWRWTPEDQSDQVNAWRGGDELLVPLTGRDGGRMIGFLSVNDPEHGQRPEREEVELLEIFADQAVVALRNAYLLAKAREQAERDHITGLFNHRAADERLQAELSSAQRDGASLGLVTLDLDGFKHINDTYGHATGDLALRHVADLLGRCTRAHDTAARMGGDEFALILPGASQPKALAVVERLMALALDTPVRVEGAAPVLLHFSVGVATYPEDADQAHTLLAIADTRLYKAKRLRKRSPPKDGGRNADETTLEGIAMLNALMAAVDKKDSYTRTHSERVASFACALGEALGLSGETIRVLRLAGLLHDVGKIGVPICVLRKPDRLDPDEWGEMKQHVSLSTTLLRTAVPNPDVHMAVGHHHERWDGTGYPSSVAGHAISLLGRIMAIADAAAAMGMDRPYRKKLSRAAMIEELRKGSGTQFDPDLVEPFIAVLGRFREDANRRATD